MDLKKEFDSIWIDIERIVMSSVIRNINSPVFYLDDVQETYDKQIEKWTRGKLREKYWYDSLNDSDSNQSAAMLDKAKSFRFQLSGKKTPSLLPYYLMSILLSVTAFVIFVNIFKFSAIMKVLLGIVCIVISFTIITPIGKNKQDCVRKDIANDYREQMGNLKKELSEIMDKLTERQ